MSTYDEQMASQSQQEYQTQQPVQHSQQVYPTQQPPQQPQTVYVQQPYHTTQPQPTLQSTQAAAPVPVNAAPTTSFLGLDVASSTFWKGALLGAGITLLVTSETVQKTVMKGITKMMTATSSGIEELKEKYEDAKAEVDAEDAGI